MEHNVDNLGSFFLQNKINQKEIKITFFEKFLGKWSNLGHENLGM